MIGDLNASHLGIGAPGAGEPTTGRLGEPTAGWIIYTWNAQLIDGSSFRLPRMRVTDSQGRDMELHPRPVDVPVERPLGESSDRVGPDFSPAIVDSQLHAAVQELLKQIGGIRK